MLTAVRILLVLAGVFLFLLGVFKAWWEVKAWEVMSTLELRPASINGKPRMGDIRIFIVVASIGAALAAAAILPWIWQPGP